MRFIALTIMSLLLWTTAGSALAEEKLSAVGIGVTNLEISTRFYTQTLGLEVLRTYELGYLNEIVLGHADTDHAVLVLMNWPNDKNRKYDGSNVKVVFNHPDAATVLNRARALGSTIDREALPHPALNGTIIGLTRDPDNYVLEVIER
ncbi:MAG: VOC family protein [Pseudomonadales bacterium]